MDSRALWASAAMLAIAAGDPAEAAKLGGCADIETHPKATPVEKAICSDEALQDLDTAMQQLFDAQMGSLAGAPRKAYVKKQKP